MFDKKYFRYLLWAVIAVLFLGIYSPATSPLAIYYGADSAFFIMVARGMKEGLLPYRDFFDMKGPYFFLIQYVGQLIYTGRFGAFIIQCINLFFSLIIIDNIYISEAKIKKITNYIDLFKLFLVGIFPCLWLQ